VDAASCESGNQSRDRRMQRRSWIASVMRNSFSFPISWWVDLNGTSQVQIHGLLKIHGTTHERVLPVKAKVSPGQLTATTIFVVPYVKMGMKNPSTLLLKVNQDVG
jgi:polyisoprenoid-binding protein YceI